MKYKTVPSVILTSVCGHNFLVSTRENIEVNETVALCWKRLMQGVDVNELVHFLETVYEETPQNVLQKDVQDLVETLTARHLLMRYRP